jgi:phage shock protein E
MIQFFKNLFGFGERVDLGALIASGATIIDVRTVGEFQSGHIKQSVNIPLNILPNSVSKMDKNKPLIMCCASGMRSSSAKSLLTSYGFTEVHNGGSWTNLQQFEK